MKPYVAIILASCALTGCQTDAQVRSAAPLEQHNTKKSPDAAVTCLIPALTNNYKAIQQQRFVAQTIAPGSEYDIVPTGGFVNGHYTYTINVKASGAGSTISLYKGQMMMPNITDSIRAGISACL